MDNITEKPEDHILVANGDMFDGTRDMFRDCFFDNATNEQIESWCRQNNWALIINGETIFENG